MIDNKRLSVKELLEQIIKESSIDEDIKDQLSKISFRLKYNDPVLKAELTPPYLATLNEYQESVYFAYLSLSGKKEDLRYLTNEEKDALSLKFKIEEGSDIIDVMAENSDKLITLIGDKMDGTQIKQNELDILKTEQLLKALGKNITAKLIIEKIDGVITNKIIENVEIIESVQ